MSKTHDEELTGLLRQLGRRGDFVLAALGAGIMCFVVALVIGAMSGGASFFDAGRTGFVVNLARVFAILALAGLPVALVGLVFRAIPAFRARRLVESGQCTPSDPLPGERFGTVRCIAVSNDRLEFHPRIPRAVQRAWRVVVLLAVAAVLVQIVRRIPEVEGWQLGRLAAAAVIMLGVAAILLKLFAGVWILERSEGGWKLVAERCRLFASSRTVDVVPERFFRVDVRDGMLESRVAVVQFKDPHSSALLDQRLAMFGAGVVSAWQCTRLSHAVTRRLGPVAPAAREG